MSIGVDGGLAAIILTGVEKIATQLAKLRESRDKRRKDRFEVLRNLYDECGAVHSTYCDLFYRTWSKLPQMDGLYQWRVEGKVIPEGHDDYVQTVASAKRFFLDSRQQGEHLRDNLRENAKAYLEAGGDKEEKRFLVALMDYFLDDGMMAPDVEYLDRTIENIERLGGIAARNTPSSRLAIRLAESDDADILRAVLKEAINALNQRWSNVVRTYTPLRRAAAAAT